MVQKNILVCWCRHILTSRPGLQINNRGHVGVKQQKQLLIHLSIQPLLLFISYNLHTSIIAISIQPLFLFISCYLLTSFKALCTSAMALRSPSHRASNLFGSPRLMPESPSSSDDSVSESSSSICNSHKSKASQNGLCWHGAISSRWNNNWICPE